MAENGRDYEAEYANIQGQLEYLNMKKKQMEEEILAPVADRIAMFEKMIEDLKFPYAPDLDALDAEFAEKFEAAQKNLEKVADEWREAVVAAGETHKGSFYRCEYIRPKLTVDKPEKLIEYAKEHPEVFKFVKVGRATTRIVPIK